MIQEFIIWAWWVIVVAYLFMLPGWALLSALWPGWKNLVWAEKLGLSLGVGLALYPAIIEIVNVFGFKPGALLAYLPGAAGFIFLLWNQRVVGRRFRDLDSIRSPHSRSYPKLTKSAWAEIVLAMAILLTIFTRLWAIRNIGVPMWGDSIQHTAITQLILDHGGLFKSWAPYAAYKSLTVHFGFPLQAALFAWITKLPSHTSVLVTSQLINAIAVICLLPLAFRFTRRNYWAAIGVVVAAGLLSSLPAFYVNWGRFPQLSGLAILPAAIWMTWDILQDFQRYPPQQIIDRAPANGSDSNHPVNSFSSIGQILIPSIFIGLVLAGMALTYYRMPFYWITFLAGLLLIWLFTPSERQYPSWISLLARMIVIGFFCLVFLAPWLLQLRNSSLSDTLTSGRLDVNAFTSIMNGFDKWRSLGDYVSPVLGATACIALVWAIFRKKWEVLSLGLWVVLLLAYFSGRIIRLPGSNMLEMFAILIWLYVPSALLAGWLVGEISQQVIARFPNFGMIILSTGLILAALFGANRVKSVANPQVYSMVTEADLKAMDWIQENTIPDAKFLVEGSLIYNGKTIVGSDAGWWIPLLAHRQNTMPPQYALGNEIPNEPDTSQRLIDLVRLLTEQPLGSSEVMNRLCREGITHIYIGQRSGAVGFGIKPLFSAKDMIGSTLYESVYQEDRVQIFEFNRSNCIP